MQGLPQAGLDPSLPPPAKRKVSGRELLPHAYVVSVVAGLYRILLGGEGGGLNMDQTTCEEHHFSGVCTQVASPPRIVRCSEDGLR